MTDGCNVMELTLISRGEYCKCRKEKSHFFYIEKMTTPSRKHTAEPSLTVFTSEKGGVQKLLISMFHNVLYFVTAQIFACQIWLLDTRFLSSG